MRTHTDDFKNEIKSLGRQVAVRITYGNTTLDNEDIVSFTLNYDGDVLKSVMKSLKIDSNIDIPLETVINAEIGVLVNGEYEYINYGSFIVNKSEKQENTNSYLLTCYDKMLYSMIPYEDLNITYPITIRNYISAICTKLNLTFANASDTFVNSEKEISNELYLDDQGNSLDYTFRDVLDELAQVTASTICINSNDELEIRYVQNVGEYTTVEGTDFQLANVDDGTDLELILKGNTTQDGTPTPSSPVPINVVTGKQEIDICGKNLCLTDFSNWESGQYNTSGDKEVNTSRIRLKEYLKVNQSTTYYFNCFSANDRFVIREYDENRTFTNSIGGVANETTITTRADTYYIGVSMYSNTNQSRDYATYQTMFTNGDIKPLICLNSASDKSYEPYTGYTQEINLGKNLLKLNDISETTASNTVKYSVNNGIVSLDGTPNSNSNIAIDFDSFTLQAGKYNFFLLRDTTTRIDISIRGLNGVVVNATNFGNVFQNKLTNKSFTLTEPTTFTKMVLYVLNETTYKDDLKFMITKSADTTYSSYFIPIELCKMGNYQDFIRKGTGEQLFDGLMEQGTFNSSGLNTSDTTRIRTINYINVEENTKYTIKCKNLSSKTIQYSVSYYDKNDYTTARLSYLSWNTNNPLTFTTPSGCKYIRFLISFTDNSTITTGAVCDIQIEKGEQVSTLFEPYGFKDKWYIGKKIGKTTLDTFTWGSYTPSDTGLLTFRTRFADIRTYSQRTLGACNYFKATDGLAQNNEITNARYSNYYNLECVDTSKTANEFNTWVSQTRPILYYILATPTYTEITNNELLVQLESFRLLNGLNNIVITSANLSSPITLTYLSERDTIDEEYLKNVNVNFGEQYGPINTITLSRSADSDNISKSIPEDLSDADKIEIKISDNQILNGNNRDEYIDAILNKLYGLSYYVNDYSSTGILYYDLCDKYNISIGDTTYSCVMLNDEINVNSGLVENVHTDMPETSKTDYTKTDKTDRKINQTYLIVDKQNGQIEALASRVDEEDEKISQLTIASDSIQTNVSTINDTLTEQISTLQTSTSLQISAINQTLENGVETLTNNLVRVDINGINVSTNVSKISTIMTNSTFAIKDTSNTYLAYFGYDEVEGRSKAEMDNLTITNYLTAGAHRIEKYEDENTHEIRTGYFYVGGGN